MSGWLNFNDSINSLKGQISNFATNVLADTDEGNDLSNYDYEELQKICLDREREIEKLQKTNEELRSALMRHGGQNGDNSWNWTPGNEEKTFEKEISHLKSVIKELEAEKNDLVSQLEQLDSENQQNLSQLVGIREKLQEENEELKEKCAQLKQQHKVALSRVQELENATTTNLPVDNTKYEIPLKNNQKLKFELEETKKELSVLKSTHDTLEKTLENTKKDHEAYVALAEEKLSKMEQHMKLSEIKSQEDAENCQKLASILESYERQVSSLKTKVGKSAEMEDMLTQLKNDNKKLKKELEEGTAKENMHRTYVNILTENAKRYVDSEGPNNAPFDPPNDPHVLEFNKQVESIFRIIVESKEKCDQLEKKLLEASQEKTQILEEKNTEIEKLMQNSEELSQEITNLLTNNDLLMSELKSYKNSGLETISESNEDNMVLLESDLENANKRISELEGILKSAPHDDYQEDQPENAPISDYQELLSSFDELKVDFEATTKELGLAKTTNKNLNAQLERLKADFENTEYQLSEANFSIDSLKEELDTIRDKLEIVILENKDLKAQIMQNIDIKSELNEVKEKWLTEENLRREFEAQVRTLVEKLQNSKMVEKSLKLQYDTLSKEHAAAVEAKHNLELSLASAKQYETNYTDLLQKYDQVLVKCEDLSTQIYQRDNQILKLEHALMEAEENLQKAQSGAADSKITVELEEEVVRLANQLRKVELNKKELEEHLERQEKKIKTKEELQKAQSEFAGSEAASELNKKEEEIVRLGAFLSDAKLSKRLLEESLERQDMEIDQLKANEELQKVGTEGVVAKLALELGEKEKEIVRLNDRLHKVELEKSEFEELLKMQEKELEHLKNQSGAADVKMDFELRNRDEELFRLNSVLNEAELKNYELKDHLKRQENEVDQFKTEIVGLKASIKQNETLTEKLQDEALKQSQETTKLGVELQKRDEEIVSLKVLLSEAELKRRELEATLLNQKEALNDKGHEEVNTIQEALKQSQDTIKMQELQLQELVHSKNELINLVTVKHQESLSYHQEIQRLTQLLQQLEAQLVHASKSSDELAKKDEEIDSLKDQVGFLKEKCDVLAKNLIEEQSKGPSDKEVTLGKQLERLQSHLMEVEEHYTQELVQAEQKNAELQARVTELEQREKNSSTMYTSVSIRANQQVEALQSQLQQVTHQRDELRREISMAEDRGSKQAAALANLQFVLEQFQKDKEKDVMKETERIRRQIKTEKQVQDELQKEISNLKAQLEESKQGLQAASRLSDQLEHLKRQNSGLKEEVSQLQQKLSKSDETIRNIRSQTDGKIDKSLIKNLVVGFLASGQPNWNKDQSQVLKIIATVLDFNQQDHDKVKLNQPQQGSWLTSLLFPHGPDNQQNVSQETLSQAFVKFLESESQPRVVPSLLNEQPIASSTNTTKKTNPIVLNEVVLPTFADFGPSRNSSSILKDVLKDNQS